MSPEGTIGRGRNDTRNDALQNLLVELNWIGQASQTRCMSWGDCIAENIDGEVLDGWRSMRASIARPIRLFL